MRSALSYRTQRQTSPPPSTRPLTVSIADPRPGMEYFPIFLKIFPSNPLPPHLVDFNLIQRVISPFKLDFISLNIILKHPSLQTHVVTLC